MKGCFKKGLFTLGFFLCLTLKGDHFVIFADQKTQFVRAVPFHRATQSAMLGHSNGMQKSIERFFDRTFVCNQKAGCHDRDQQAKQDHVNRDTSEQQVLNTRIGEVNHQFANIVADIVAFEIDPARQAQRVSQFGLGNARMGKFGAVCAQCLHGDNVAITCHGVQRRFDIVDVKIPERCRQNARVNVGSLFNLTIQVVTQNLVADIAKHHEQREREQRHQRQCNE